MADKTSNINEHINKKDLELILEVNKKAIEIETALVEQNEDIVTALSDIKKSQSDHTTLLNDIKKEQNEQDSKMEKIIKQSEDTSKDIFKIQVLFATGLISLIIQIIQIFMKK